MADTLYVRRQMLPPEPAPRTAVGPVGWMRANLFSGWVNSILTLLCITNIGEYLHQNINKKESNL